MVERLLYLYRIYERMKYEREEDISLLFHVCDKIHDKNIGRHSSICVDAQRRVSQSILRKSVEELIQETIHKSLEPQTIVVFTIIIISFLFIIYIYNKLFAKPQTIPLTIKEKAY